MIELTLNGKTSASDCTTPILDGSRSAEFTHIHVDALVARAAVIPISSIHNEGKRDCETR